MKRIKIESVSFIRKSVLNKSKSKNIGKLEVPKSVNEDNHINTDANKMVALKKIAAKRPTNKRYQRNTFNQNRQGGNQYGKIHYQNPWNDLKLPQYIKSRFIQSNINYNNMYDAQNPKRDYYDGSNRIQERYYSQQNNDFCQENSKYVCQNVNYAQQYIPRNSSLLTKAVYKEICYNFGVSNFPEKQFQFNHLRNNNYIYTSKINNNNGFNINNNFNNNNRFNNYGSGNNFENQNNNRNNCNLNNLFSKNYKFNSGDQDYNPFQDQHHLTKNGFLYNYQLIGDDFFLSMATMELNSRINPRHRIAQSGFCVSGQTIRDATYRVLNWPQLSEHVIVNIGSVDILHGQNLFDMIGDFNDLVWALKQRGIEPIITTIAPLANMAHLPDIVMTVNKFNEYLKNNYPCVIDFCDCLVEKNGRIFYECYQT